MSAPPCECPRASMRAHCLSSASLCLLLLKERLPTCDRQSALRLKHSWYRAIRPRVRSVSCNRAGRRSSVHHETRGSHGSSCRDSHGKFGISALGAATLPLAVSAHESRVALRTSGAPSVLYNAAHVALGKRIHPAHFIHVSNRRCRSAVDVRRLHSRSRHCIRHAHYAARHARLQREAAVTRSPAVRLNVGKAATI